MTDRKTKLEPLQPPAEQFTLEEAQPIRPLRRIAYPRLIIRGDSDDAASEVIWLRTPLFTLGRAEGDLCFPVESLMSASHCRFKLVALANNQWAWVIEDLDSRHGTYMRCKETELTPGMEILIGGTRLRLHGNRTLSKLTSNPHVDYFCAPAEQISGIDQLEVQSYSITHPANFLSLGPKRTEIGRLSHEALRSDPFLEPNHLVIERIAAATWKVKDRNSLNGLWVRINTAYVLTNSVQILAGEQRIDFELP